MRKGQYPPNDEAAPAHHAAPAHTFQCHWSRVYFGQDKANCQRWTKEAVVDLPPGPGRHFELTLEHALELYRVHSVMV